MPWHNKTGLAKATAILATVFTLSLGLCGANLVAFTRFGAFDGPQNWRSTLLWDAGYAELFAILGSLLGLFIILIINAGRSMRGGSK
jgi:hypothetical protein